MVILCVALACPLAADDACAPARPDLMGWWCGEGNAKDAINGTEGELHGNVSYTDGKVGKAFQLDGSSYVRVPASDATDIGSGSGITVELWINPTDVESSPPKPMVEWRQGARVGTHLQIFHKHGQLFSNLIDTTGRSHEIDSGVGMIRPNIFQHVAVTYDKKTGVAALYINGVEMAEEQFEQFTPLTTGDLYFGARTEGGLSPAYYKGAMDEIGIYNQALPAEAIRAIFQAGSAGKCPTQ